MKEILFIIGESGSGKTYLQEKLLMNFPDIFCNIVSTTTRAQREDEFKGVHYHFTDRATFLERLGDFIQYDDFGNNLYGTLISEYEKPQAVGMFVCTPIGVNDTMSALKKRGIEMDHKIIFFNATDNLIKSHGVSLERIMRGDIRSDFTDRYFRNEFNASDILFLNDNDINNLDIHKITDWVIQ